MKHFFSFLSKNQSNIYRVFLFVICTFLVIYLLPKGGQFKYTFQKGKPWQYENLYAPFSFTIKKSEEDLTTERTTIRENAIPYFDYNGSVVTESFNQFEQLLNTTYVDSLFTVPKSSVKSLGVQFLEDVYRFGVLSEVNTQDDDDLVYLKKGNEIDEIAYSQIIKKEEIPEKIARFIQQQNAEAYSDLLKILLNRSSIPNVTANNKLTEAAIASELDAINPNQGIIEKGGRIIAKGEVEMNSNHRSGVKAIGSG